LKVFHPNRYLFPLPPEHRFPIEKYTLLQSELIHQGILSPDELIDAPLATRDMITLAHTTEYYNAVMDGSLDTKIIRQIGLPWSPELANAPWQPSVVQFARLWKRWNQAFRATSLAGRTTHWLIREMATVCSTIWL